MLAHNSSHTTVRTQQSAHNHNSSLIIAMSKKIWTTFDNVTNWNNGKVYHCKYKLNKFVCVEQEQEIEIFK